MIVEGFFDYQNSLEIDINLNHSGNFFYFENGFIRESGFSSTSDCYYSLLIGGIQKNSIIQSFNSSTIADENISLDTFSKNLLDTANSKPKACAWYNESSAHLYLAREIFGTIPLFYIHIPNVFVTFSTDLVTLINRKEVREHLEINTSRIVSFLSNESSNLYTDVTDTFFTKIKSVPPGHLLTITPQSISTIPFETFDTYKSMPSKNLAEFARLLTQSLKKSVANCTAEQTKSIGSQLSGGLDSSSVSSLFKILFPDRSLHTFYIAANNAESDESVYSSTVAENINSIHHEFHQPTDDLNHLQLSTHLYGQPETSYLSPASNLGVIAYAKNLNCDILLTGHGGDSIIGNGMEVLDDAFFDKNWSQLQVLLQAKVPYFNSTENYPDWQTYSHKKKYNLVLQNFLYNKISFARKLPASELLKLYFEISQKLGISNFYFIKRAFRSFFLRLTGRNIIIENSLIRRDFFNSVSREENKFNLSDSLLNGLPSTYSELFSDVFHEHTMRGQEQHFVLGKHFGISVRAPYFDKELFELCMAIPDILKFGDGKGREHLREAMKGILAEPTRTRSTKASLSSPDGEEMTFRLYEQAQYYLAPNRNVWKYVDQEKFDNQIEIIKNKKIPYIQKSKSYFHVTRTISLSVWLEWLKENNILNQDI